jgi:hypothetical protein
MHDRGNVQWMTSHGDADILFGQAGVEGRWGAQFIGTVYVIASWAVAGRGLIPVMMI